MKIFVFGSNTGGCHRGGAAHHAYKKHGARWGEGVGHFGDSYAIPTKLGHKEHGVGKTLPLEVIKGFVEGFIAYAMVHPELTFQVTCIGCGLAGLKHEDVAPMFQNAPGNCYFDTLWKPYLPEGVEFWGTF